MNAPKPQETDIHRVDGNRLYFLNSYRGLMVFDIMNTDDPKLLGRSPVHGTPVEVFVENGIATMVVGDWYGNAPDGSPFHGSVVRPVDARAPAHMKVHGEVQVKGWARDMRVVGLNHFIVNEDYGWHYGVWYGGYYGGAAAGDVAYPGAYYGGSSKVVISSVKFGNFAPTMNSTKEFDGYSGAFKVTSNEILMEHDVLADGPQGSKPPTGKSAIDYFAFSQLDGALLPMGTFEVDGLLSGWSAYNGRWNIDLDGTTASIITCAGADSGYCVKELTLARNVVAAEPNGATIAQLSTDWWGYDNKTSELRVLPIADAEESVTDPNAKSVSIDGTNARVFRNGDLAYVVTTLYPTNPNGPWYATPRVQVVDLSNGGATLEGSLDPPQETNGSYWSWWGGCYYRAGSSTSRATVPSSRRAGARSASTSTSSRRTRRRSTRSSPAPAAGGRARSHDRAVTCSSPPATGASGSSL